jgi:hypothetical protein
LVAVGHFTGYFDGDYAGYFVGDFARYFVGDFGGGWPLCRLLLREISPLTFA